MQVSEALIREALEGQFTFYVGRPEGTMIRRAVKPQIKPSPGEAELELMRAREEAKVRAFERALAQPMTLAQRILLIVAQVHGFTVEDIMGTSRSYPLARARHHAVYEIRTRLDTYSLPKIGRIFGRDHSTILNSLDKFQRNRHQYVVQLEAVERMLTTNEVK